MGDLNTGRDSGAGVGTEPAALCIGGGTPSAVDNVESWNGSAWTNGTALNTAKKHTWGIGTQTAAITAGTPATTESWNGSAWTEMAETNTDHRNGAGGGTQTDAIVFAGDNAPGGYTVNTETWDASSWTEIGNLSTARAYNGGGGPSTSNAITFGGSTPAQTNTTEEFSKAVAAVTFTSS